jgi:glyoxylase-like metal-dependent hydrolase (beta-lactamase superfamily II)
MPLEITPFFHEPTGSFSYLVADATTRAAAIIDAVLDYDARGARLSGAHADQIAGRVQAQRLSVQWILETHAHADHVSAGAYLREKLGGKLAIGSGIQKVQANFKRIFNLGEDFSADGSQFDHLFADGESFMIGALQARVLATPGHTSDSITYLIGDAAFIGDTLFAPDTGSARCDFPGGDANVLYQSVQKLYALPEATRLYLCHDYPPDTRAPRADSTLAEQRARNMHLHAGVTQAQFVAMRTARDKTLELPQLILPAIQMNIRGGRKPAAETNGVSYLKLPIDTL